VQYNLLFQSFLIAQHAQHALVLHTFIYVKYVKPEAAITVFELLIMGGVSPEIC
jgi:hypothetical protein